MLCVVREGSRNASVALGDGELNSVEKLASTCVSYRFELYVTCVVLHMELREIAFRKMQWFIVVPIV